MGSTTSKLASINPSDVSDVPYKNKLVRCRIVSVYDGDTCTAIFLIGNKPFKIKIRFDGIDAPEIKGSSSKEKSAAIVVRKYVQREIDGKIVWLKIRTWDKYGGRVLGELYLKKNSYSVNSELLEKNFVRQYNGEKKKPWTDKELDYIIESYTDDLL